MKNFICIFLCFVIIIFSLIFCEIQQASSNNISFYRFTHIIIDAGHGGEDGGAVANDGTLEKNLNLDISLKLNDIMSVLGYKTTLIRNTDTDLHTSGDTIRERKVSDIRNRYEIMNKSGNSLYISIHQNKFSDSSVNGAQTFYSPNNDESKLLADFIQKSIASQLQMGNNRVIKKSGTDIFLLYNATKPTVMIECGFISNASDLNNLKNTKYQNEMALSIAIGILNYNISEVQNGSEI
jgi:N-acetylmuramoyl-L-alanine amidase